LLGSPHYEPIFAAANDAEITVVTHPTRNYGHSQGSPMYAGAHPATDAERYANLPTVAQGNIVDMMWEGTFEKYPKLRIVFIEFGWHWLGTLTWKMDASWKAGGATPPGYARRRRNMCSSTFVSRTTR